MTSSEPTKPNSDPTADRTATDCAAADFQGRLVAEALRSYEAARPQAIDDRRAVALARACPGDLEQKIVVRARNLGLAAGLTEAVRHLRGTTRVSLALAGLLALVAGGTTAHTALQAPAATPVNFHWALVSLLGVESLALLLWIAISLARPKSASASSLGLALAALGRRITAWLHRGPVQAAVLQAAGASLARGAIGRWSLGAVTHGLWLAFLAGALAMALLLLSAKQVSFAWQTTILSERSYLPLTEGLAALPRLAGFPVPSRDEIRDSRWDGASPVSNGAPMDASQAWSGLLVGSLVLYGLLPRGLLLLLCLAARARALGRFRLDLGLPEYQRLAADLVPPAHRDGVIDGDDAAGGAVPDSDTRDEPIAFTGPLAVLALEIEPADGSPLWPPPLPGIEWRDLGTVDSREERERACAAATATQPGLLLVAVSLLTSPDRGVGAFLARIERAANAPLCLLLSDRRRLAARNSASEAEQRIRDWRALLVRSCARPGWAIPYDLAAPEESERAKLAALLEGRRP